MREILERTCWHFIFPRRCDGGREMKGEGRREQHAAGPPSNALQPIFNPLQPISSNPLLILQQ